VNRDNHKLKFKSCSPVETVERILNKLNELGIELDEEWMDISDIGTYSLRVSLKGTLIGANGKGMTKEYARASAYAEFCERLQNYKLVPNQTFCTLIANNSFKFSFFPEERRLTSEELIREDSSFIRMVLDRRGVGNSSAEEKKAVLKKLQKMDYNVYGVEDSFLCVPFYSLREKKVQYIPYFMYNLHYGSNGMCAGNDMDEALVQGISEIFERIVHARISREKPVLPDISEDYVKK
jgi:ribosomal protein S12 methylthiotransferase accessory factor